MSDNKDKETIAKLRELIDILTGKLADVCFKDRKVNYSCANILIKNLPSNDYDSDSSYSYNSSISGSYLDTSSDDDYNIDNFKYLSCIYSNSTTTNNSYIFNLLLPSIEATSESDNNLFLEKFYIDIKGKEFIKTECDKYYKEQIYDLDKQIEIYNKTIKKNLHILKEECEYEKKHKFPYLYSLDISRIKNDEKLIITNIKKIKDSEEINKNNTVRYYRNFYKYSKNNCYIQISIDYDSINNVINLINNKILIIYIINYIFSMYLCFFCLYVNFFYIFVKKITKCNFFTQMCFFLQKCNFIF